MHCPSNAATRHYHPCSVPFLLSESTPVSLGKVFTYCILLVLAAFSTAAYSQMDPARTADGLVAFYPFDEGSHRLYLTISLGGLIVFESVE
jgi:hypothetical protein